MNLCINCKEGTTFLSSKEDSEEAHSHTRESIFFTMLISLLMKLGHNMLSKW